MVFNYYTNFSNFCNTSELLFIYKKTRNCKKFSDRNFPIYQFLKHKWYIDELYDLILVKPIRNVGLIFWKKGDQNLIDRFGPDGISKMIKLISNKSSKFQTGYIYDYAFVMLIGLSALITFLIIK